MTAKQIAKEFIARSCSPRLQQKLRQIYAIHQVTHGRHFREPELALIAQLVSNGDVVADIGANVGVYTKELSMAAGPFGRVFSFEPILETYEILVGLIQKAQLHNVCAIHAAIG